MRKVSTQTKSIGAAFETSGLDRGLREALEFHDWLAQAGGAPRLGQSSTFVIPAGSQEICQAAQALAKRQKDQYDFVRRHMLGLYDYNHQLYGGDLPNANTVSEFIRNARTVMAATDRALESCSRSSAQQDTIQRLSQHYEQALLRESGYSSKEEVASRIAAIEDEICGLESRVFGRARFRKRLKQLGDETKHLENLPGGRWFSNPIQPPLFSFSPQEMARFGEQRRGLLSALKERSERLLVNVSNAVNERFTTQASSMLADRWSRLAELYCSQELVPYLRQKLKESRRHGAARAMNSATALSLDSPDGRLVIRLAKEMVTHAIVFDSFSPDPAVKAFSKALLDLPHAFAEPLQNLQRQDLRNHAVGLLALTQMLAHEETHQLMARVRNIGPIAEYALKKFEPGTFNVAAQFLMRERLVTADTMARLKSLMVEPIVAKLTTSQEHKDETIKLGWKLYALPDTRALPFAVLNAFRESGYSGEKPFLSIHAANGRDTVLYQYLSRLSAEDLHTASGLEVPGLSEAIDLIRRNGRNFARSKMYRRRPDGSDGDRLVPNPVWDALQSALHEMCLHYLKHGSRNEQFFVIAVIEDFEGELPAPLLDQLAKVMKQSDGELREELYDLLLTRVSRGKLEPRLARIAIGNFANQDSADEVDFNVVGRAFAAFLGRELPDEVRTDLAKLFSVSGEKITALHELASIIRGQEKMGWFRSFDPYSQELGLTLQALLACTNIPEATERLELLYEAGYRYVDQHVRALPQLLRDFNRVAADGRFIRRYEPEFCFEPKEKFGEKGVFETDPFHQWFETGAKVSALSKVEPVLRSEGKLPVECRNGLIRHLVASYAGDWPGLSEVKLVVLGDLIEAMLREPPEQQSRNERILGAYASFLSRGLAPLSTRQVKELFCKLVDDTQDGIFNVMASLHLYWPGVARDAGSLQRLLAPLSEIAANGVTEHATWRSLLGLLDAVRPQLQGSVSAFEELETLANYVREFGVYNLPRTFGAYLTLQRKEAPSPDLAAIGVNETGPEGVRQLKDHLAAMRKNLLSPLGTLVPGSPIDVELLTVISRFEESQWARGSNLAQLVNRFNADLNAGNIRAAPSWLSAGAFRVEKVDSELLSKFEFAGPVRERFEQLRGDIQAIERGDLVATGSQLIGQVVHALEARRAELGEPLSAQERAKDPQGKRESGRQKEAQRVRVALEQLKRLEVKGAAQIDAAIQVISEFERTDSADTTPALRWLVLMRALGLAHRSTDFHKLSEASLRLESLASLTELYRDVVIEETLPQLSLSKRAIHRIKQACSTKALEEEIDRIGKLASSGFEEWTAVPCRGLLGELSGYIGDACWTRLSDIMRQHPNVTPVILVKNYGRQNERIIGALLLIEACSESGEPAIVLRGVNPQQNHITRVKADSFFEALVEQWLAPQAKHAQVRWIGVPGGQSGGSQTNRPTLNAYINSSYAKAAFLHLADDPPTIFNGHDISMSCVVVRDLAKTDALSVSPG